MLLLFGLLLLIKPVIPLLEYVVNYDYISKVLCENKAKPEMKCNGKCHLMKEMAKASEEEKPLQNEKKASHHEFETLFIAQLPSFEIRVSNESIQNTITTNYSDLYCYEGASSVFHPPTV
ncbi:hypothetical protein EQG63_00625 [Flavobacterium amnicola]|uniref:Uncharacterized protein n=1 Tax=Flavobacterium amnicola TaxID=2506422 RepID=A0A4Q1K4H9_9FLAO|nr:hypothetical protein [Flavobacterium amnicola]RXR20467.1 hypothetical protein EQG63_00625 [Flavobacterium amnicola]